MQNSLSSGFGHAKRMGEFDSLNHENLFRIIQNLHGSFKSGRLFFASWYGQILAQFRSKNEIFLVSERNITVKRKSNLFDKESSQLAPLNLSYSASSPAAAREEGV